MRIAACFFVFISFSVAFAEEKSNKKEVNALIEKMGDKDFKVRETAYNRLVEMVQKDDGSDLLPALEKAREHNDLEIVSRAERVIRQYYFVMPTDYPFLPWIDSLPDDFPNRWKIISRYLQLVPPDDSFTWLIPPDRPQFRCYRYRLATAHFCRALLKNGMTRSQVRSLLDKMAKEDIRRTVRDINCSRGQY